jgi:hypothetical protein
MTMDIVRVGTLNNFNCTPAEWAQLDDFTAQNPDKFFFINCNAKTPLLQTINDHPYRAVITLNPDLFISEDLLNRVLSLDRSKIAFVRIKWLPALEGPRRDPVSHRQVWPGRPEIEQAITLLRHYGIEVVITSQRFNGNKSLAAHAPRAAYTWECNRHRISGIAWKSLVRFAKNTGAQICDKAGLGCQGCHLCSTLNGHSTSDRILSLNLSSSGICPYNCVDCYAKTMQKFVVSCGNKPIRFDKIMANKKQKGQTKHIQNNRKAA